MTTIPAPASPLDRFFATLHRSSLTRSPNRLIGGVCSGVAEQFGFSVRAARIVAVLLAIVGAAVPLYLLGWLLLPSRTGTVHLERAIRGRHAGSILLLAVTLLSILPDHHVHGHHTPWGLLLVAAVAAFVFARSRGGCHGRSAQAGTPTNGRGTDGPQDVRPS